MFSGLKISFQVGAGYCQVAPQSFTFYLSSKSVWVTSHIVCNPTEYERLVESEFSPGCPSGSASPKGENKHNPNRPSKRTKIAHIGNSSREIEVNGQELMGLRLFNEFLETKSKRKLVHAYFKRFKTNPEHLEVYSLRDDY